MTHTLRTIPHFLTMLLAAGFSAHFAMAQVGSTSSPPAASPPNDAPGVPPGTVRAREESESNRFCREHWLAMGRCRDRRWAGPEIMFGVDLGLSVMTETNPFGFNEGVGRVTDAGPAWGLRAGIELLPWLGVEARYVGMYDAAQASVSPAGSAGLLTTGGEAVVRLTAPTPFVRPYLFGGAGYYDIALTGSSSARAASLLHSSSQPGIPLGVGLDLPLTWYLRLDLEATYHYQRGESFSAVKTNGIDGGDPSTLNAVLRVRL
ncbi:MAG: outer membrane beta-barrel protein [Polyangiaceae bacterium]